MLINGMTKVETQNRVEKGEIKLTLDSMVPYTIHLPSHPTPVLNRLPATPPTMAFYSGT